MPVAKLSRRFYETFGDEVANELAEWFNLVDATYRLQLREFNDINFQRFDAKLEERLATFHTKLERRTVALDAKWETRFAELDAKWETRFAELDAKWETRIAELRTEFRVAMAQQKTDLIKWMFGFWIGNVVTTAGIILAVAAVLS